MIKHGVLRLRLHHSDHIPWNYARFLDYAAERLFLRQVGGGHIFIHRLLGAAHSADTSPRWKAAKRYNPPGVTGGYS